MAGVPPYPTTPAPTTYVNGPLLVSELREDETNGVTFLANRASLVSQNTTAPTVVISEFEPIQSLVPITDNWAGLAPLLFSAYFCQVPGWYLFEGFVPYGSPGASQVTFGAALVANVGSITAGYQGQTHMVASGQNVGVFISELVELFTASPPYGSGDNVELATYVTGAVGTATVASPAYPTLSARWVSSGTASTLTVPQNGTAPTPPNYLGTTWLNANIRDTLNFLTGPPVFRYGYQPGSQAVASGTWPNPSTISLNALTVDNFSGWNSGGNYWAAPVEGVHYVSGQVCYNQVSGNAMVCAAGVSVNGTVTWGQAVRSNSATSGSVIASMVHRVRLNQGDHLALAGFVSAGSGTATIGAATRLIAVWESS